MRSAIDPLVTWRRRLFGTLILGSAAVVASLAWALLSPGVEAALAPAVEGPQAESISSQMAVAPIDVAAFDVQLWHIPAPPPEPDARLAKSAEVTANLILVGIVHTEGQLRAALYDPEDDRIHFVADGDVVRGVKVVRVTGDRVELVRGPSSEQLRLREDPS